MKYNEYFITCPRGLEEVTAKDISHYINDTPIPSKGGVSFNGNKEDMYKVNFFSRTGMYVLKKIHSFKAYDYSDLYQQAYKLDWSKNIGVKKTFSIRAKINSHKFQNSNFTTLKIKDAIVDSIKKKLSKRPSIDKLNPDLRLFIFINNDEIQIYYDSSGKPLFMRGYRTIIHKAALNESLAAGLVLLSNWNKKDNFYDIMCGSGTIPIEAAMIAFNIPPRILRDEYAFKKWDDYDEVIWKKLIDKAKSNINFKNKTKIFGSDLIKKNIDLCIQSLKKLSLENKVHFEQKDLNNFSPLSKIGTIIINPPYGERIGEQFNLKLLYKHLGDKFKKNCEGHDVYIFTGNPDLSKQIGLRTKKRIILKNGTIDCRLLYYPMQSGTFK